MPFNIQQSNELLMKSSDKMWSSMEFRPQKSSSRDREKSKTKSSSRERDKLKSKSVVDPCHEAKQDITLREIFQRECVEESSSSAQSEELIKYMSNLPGYLKRTDRGVNIQEKALNFGVLDWSQLEKWKNKQPHFTSFNSNEESSSSRAATTSSTTVRGRKKVDDKKGSRSSRIKGSYKEALPEISTLSSQNVQQYQTSGKKIIGGQHRMKTWEFESNRRTQLDTSLQKEKRREYDKIASTVGSFASKSRHHAVSLVPNENSNDKDIEGKSMRGLQQHSLKKKERILKSSSDKGIPSLEPKTKGVSFGSQKKMSSSSSEAKIKMDHWQESHIDVGQKQCHSMPRDIVLLRPRKFLQPRFDDYFQVSHSITSSDDNFSEASHSSSSYISLHEEFHTKEAYSDSDTIHSSVLPSATGLASSSEAIQDHSAVESMKLRCSNKMSSLQSKESCIEKDVLDIKLTNQGSLSNMKESKDHETAELKSERVWNNQSQPRLNFGLNQIGRSLSFKEDSILPINVSAKSGPLIFESSCVNNLSKDKLKGHKRSKSSPFMRLFDPILKHKASNIDQSSESCLTPKGSMKSVSFSTTTNPLDAENSKESSIQALLQLTIKNGQPLFKFIINSESKVLAATMNSLASAEKDDGSCYFTFYLVNEIKKKSGKWMSHWIKEKNCGFVYNIVGQMKISSTRITESSNKNFKGQFMVKDYVLFGVSIDQTDQGPPEFIKSRELAAAVIEIPCENVSHEGVHSINLLNKECLKCLFSNERCFCVSQENDTSGSITVILPGGVHSSPNKGEPSPLIHRWKLGGLCDCGGWDVGCKLLVLSNQNPNPNIPRSSKPPPQRFQLFVKEGAEEDTPLFILEPLKDGLYSVEFSSTISHLQAFFISVSVISNKKLPSSLEMSNMQEEMNKEVSFKNINEVQEKAPKNYNQIPPLSPVDRV